MSKLEKVFLAARNKHPDPTFLIIYSLVKEVEPELLSWEEEEEEE